GRPRGSRHHGAPKDGAEHAPPPHTRPGPPSGGRPPPPARGGPRGWRPPPAAAAIHCRWALGLGHTPEERQRTLDDAADIAAPSLIAVVEPRRHVDDVLHGGLVEACNGRLLLAQILGCEPGRHLLLHRGAVWPAKPRLLASAAHGNVGSRVGAVRAGMPGVEHAPAALAGRRFGGAALANRAPVGGNEIDCHAELLEQ